MTCKWCIAKNQYQFNAKVVGWAIGIWLPCKLVNGVHLEEGKVNVILLCCNKKWFHICSLNVSIPLRLIPSKVCKRAALGQVHFPFSSSRLPKATPIGACYSLMGSIFVDVPFLILGLLCRPQGIGALGQRRWLPICPHKYCSAHLSQEGSSI
jgi:hypothetical protein